MILWIRNIYLKNSHSLSAISVLTPMKFKSSNNSLSNLQPSLSINEHRFKSIIRYFSFLLLLKLLELWIAVEDVEPKSEIPSVDAVPSCDNLCLQTCNFYFYQTRKVFFILAWSLTKKVALFQKMLILNSNDIKHFECLIFVVNINFLTWFTKN